MRCSVGRKSPKVRDYARLSTFPFLAAQRTCARWGRHTVLMIEFEGVLLTLRCLTLSLVSLSSNGYAESSWYICIGCMHFRCCARRGGRIGGATKGGGMFATRGKGAWGVSDQGWAIS